MSFQGPPGNLGPQGPQGIEGPKGLQGTPYGPPGTQTFYQYGKTNFVDLTTTSDGGTYGVGDTCTVMNYPSGTYFPFTVPNNGGNFQYNPVGRFGVPVYIKLTFQAGNQNPPSGYFWTFSCVPTGNSGNPPMFVNFSVDSASAYYKAVSLIYNGKKYSTDNLRAAGGVDLFISETVSAGYTRLRFTLVYTIDPNTSEKIFIIM